jgi:hypothetical protein
MIRANLRAGFRQTGRNIIIRNVVVTGAEIAS